MTRFEPLLELRDIRKNYGAIEALKGITFTIGKGDIAAAFARSPHKLQRRFHHHRYAAAPMECRGVVGVHDPYINEYTFGDRFYRLPSHHAFSSEGGERAASIMA